MTELGGGGIFSYGLKFWSIFPETQEDGSVYPLPNTLISTTGFDGQYITIDFDNNIVVVRNSLYSPIINASGERKMTITLDDLPASSLVGSLPRGLSLTAGSSYVHQKLLYGVNKSIIASD